MSKREVLLMIHNFSELNSLAYNAKIRSYLKYLLFVLACVVIIFVVMYSLCLLIRFSFGLLYFWFTQYFVYMILVVVVVVVGGGVVVVVVHHVAAEFPYLQSHTVPLYKTQLCTSKVRTLLDMAMNDIIAIHIVIIRDAAWMFSCETKGQT